MAGISDVFNRLCLALALWNGRTRSSRSGCSGSQRGGQPRRGRQGVLVVPRRAARAAPGCAGATTTRRRPFPYDDLVAENGRRGKLEPEYELIDTGRLRRRPLLDRRGPLREGRPERHPDADRPSATPARSRRPSTCCRRSGSATRGSWDPDGGQAHARGAATARRSVGISPRARRLRAPRRARPRRRTARARCSARTRRTWRASAARAADAVSEGRHQRPRRARARPPSTRARTRDQGGRLVPARRSGGRSAEIRVRLTETPRTAGEPGEAGEPLGRPIRSAAGSPRRCAASRRRTSSTRT